MSKNIQSGVDSSAVNWKDHESCCCSLRPDRQTPATVALTALSTRRGCTVEAPWIRQVCQSIPGDFCSDSVLDWAHLCVYMHYNYLPHMLPGSARGRQSDSPPSNAPTPSRAACLRLVAHASRRQSYVSANIWTLPGTVAARHWEKYLLESCGKREEKYWKNY